LDTVAMNVQRSSMVNQLSVMILISIAATARYEVLKGDTKGAYLYTSIKDFEPQIYMWVDKAVGGILCEVSPTDYHRQRTNFTNIILTKWDHWDLNQ
jgi:hypothetical protein